MRKGIKKHYDTIKMSVTKTTLISHIFNEEYLLPFWLRHHKNMFDEIIIIRSI